MSLTIFSRACSCQQSAERHDKLQGVIREKEEEEKKKGLLWSFFFYHPQAFMTLFVLADVAATFSWSGASAILSQSFSLQAFTSLFLLIPKQIRVIFKKNGRPLGFNLL